MSKDEKNTDMRERYGLGNDNLPRVILETGFERKKGGAHEKEMKGREN